MGEKSVDWLIRHDLVKKTDYALYQYAVENICFHIVPFVLGLIVGIILSCIIEAFLFELMFFELRSVAGGYHMRSRMKCLISSSLVICGVVCLMSFELHRIWIYIFQMIASVIIIVNSPIENENKLLSNEEYEHQKKRTIVMIFIYALVSGAFLMFHMEGLSRAVSFSVILTGITQVPCKMDSVYTRFSQ